MFRWQESGPGIEREVELTLGLSRHRKFSALEPKPYYPPWLGKTFLVSYSVGLNTSTSFKGSTVSFSLHKVLPEVFLP